jgi:hypothetical protein
MVGRREKAGQASGGVADLAFRAGKERGKIVSPERSGVPPPVRYLLQFPARASFHSKVQKPKQTLFIKNATTAMHNLSEYVRSLSL